MAGLAVRKKQMAMSMGPPHLTAPHRTDETEAEGQEQTNFYIGTDHAESADEEPQDDQVEDSDGWPSAFSEFGGGKAEPLHLDIPMHKADTIYMDDQDEPEAACEAEVPTDTEAPTEAPHEADLETFGEEHLDPAEPAPTQAPMAEDEDSPADPLTSEDHIAKPCAWSGGGQAEADYAADGGLELLRSHLVGCCCQVALTVAGGKRGRKLRQRARRLEFRELTRDEHGYRLELQDDLELQDEGVTRIEEFPATDLFPAEWIRCCEF